MKAASGRVPNSSDGRWKDDAKCADDNNGWKVAAVQATKVK